MMHMDTPTRQQQLELWEPSPDNAAATAYAADTAHPSPDQTARGAIFTRPEVAEFILDLVGYTHDQPLHQKRLLEPAFGGGDFLLPAIRRLLHAWRRFTPATDPLATLSHAIRAVELHGESHAATRTALLHDMTAQGLDRPVAEALLQSWLIHRDFLLSPLDGEFDFIVGNPPYVRQELIPAALLAEYRRRYQTLYDRADLYVPFMERSLSLLKPGGALGFICADRWMKNRYGGPLRALIAKDFHLRIHIDMSGTQAFQSEVMAYPAITIIGRESGNFTRIAHNPPIERQHLQALARALVGDRLPEHTPQVRELARVTHGAEPWLLESSDQMALIRRLEAEFPTLEETGCKVGIGVATGADRAFIGRFDELDVEPDRKLPLATTRDIVSGEVNWQGSGVINPYTEDGRLVALADYPRLRRYLEHHRDLIANRHCAKKSPAQWYKTIDRITPALAARPKLLIPDIKGDSHVVYEPGGLYPHHNLYYITTDGWDLRALQAILLSDVTRLFIATYSTRMRGGYLRFQAQYLRRIRLPQWSGVETGLRDRLANAAQNRDLAACNAAAFALYRLTDAECSMLGGGED